MKLSSNVVGDSNDEKNFLPKLLLNNSSPNIRLSEIHLHKIRQSGGSLGRLFGPLLKTRLPLMKNVLKPLPKSVLIALGLTVAATGAAFHKETFWSSTHFLDVAKETTLIISNEEMNDIMESLEESGLLIKGVSETIKNETK